MNIRFQNNLDNINWAMVPALLKEVGMAYVDSEIHKISFQNSYAVCFAFDNDKLIGFGRSISDGVRHAAIYDVCIDPSYQGKKIGKQIVQQIMDATPGCTYFLYAAIGKEDFYKKLSFKISRTGMILFSDRSKMDDDSWVVV